MANARNEVTEVGTGESRARYDAAAQDVWREVLRRNDELVRRQQRWIHPTYLEGLHSLALPAHIPGTDELNARLEPTGWRVAPVDGYVPTATYAALVAANIFPVSRVIRRAEHIDFAPAPDMVHDILGHLPMLFSAEFRDYLKQLAKVMLNAASNGLDHEFYDAVQRMSELKSEPGSLPADVAAAEDRVKRVNRALADDASELTALRRLYVWSVEFGMAGEPQNLRVHGAALLSSPAEFRALQAGSTNSFSLEALRSENAFSEVTTQYFAAREFAEYTAVLGEYAATMQYYRRGGDHA